MTDPVDINVIVTRLLGEVPLVVAFIVFSVKIITLYQQAQTESQDKFHQAQKELTEAARLQAAVQGERVEKMLLTITSQWSQQCDKRDLEMRTFLQVIRDQDTEVINRLSEDIRANTQALNHLQNAVAYTSHNQAQSPTKPVRSRQE